MLWVDFQGSIERGEGLGMLSNSVETAKYVSYRVRVKQRGSKCKKLSLQLPVYPPRVGDPNVGHRLKVLGVDLNCSSVVGKDRLRNNKKYSC